jgi:lysophospholipase L1-like esterase
MFGGNGTAKYPQGYLWGTGTVYCGFGSPDELVQNQQAVLTFVPIQDDLYMIQNASAGPNQCLAVGVGGSWQRPARLPGSSPTSTSYCGFASRDQLLQNGQAVWRIVPQPGNRFSITNTPSGGPNPGMTFRLILNLTTPDLFAVLQAGDPTYSAEVDWTITPIAQRPLSSYTKIVIFGDSLSDQTNQNNNLPTGFRGRCPNQSLGYQNGRFTNGYNWVDFFMQDNPQISVDNQAWGGAMVVRDASFVDAFGDALIADKMTTTVTKYISKVGSMTNQLVFIFAGSNDLLAGARSTPLADPVKFADDLAVAVATSTRDILAAGGTDIILVGIPPIQEVPISDTTGFTWTPAMTTWMTSAVAEANLQLGLLAQYVKKQRGNSIFIDIGDFVHQWNTGAGGYSSPYMSDMTKACIVTDQTFLSCPFTLSWTYVDQPCLGKMYFDVLHPTALAHCGIAGKIESDMAALFGTRYLTPAPRIADCALSRSLADGRALGPY